MKIDISLIVIAVFIPLFAFAQENETKYSEINAQQKNKRQEYNQRKNEEIKALKADIAKKTPEQKSKIIEEFQDKQKEQKKAFNEVLKKETTDFLKNKITIKSMTEGQKNELANYFISLQNEYYSFSDKIKDENVDAFQNIANNKGLSVERKKMLLKEHFKKQKEKVLKYQEQKDEVCNVEVTQTNK
jgi:hypothetical protein